MEEETRRALAEVGASPRGVMASVSTRKRPLLGGAALIAPVFVAVLITFVLRPFDSGAAGTFNPVTSSTYCAEGTAQLDTNAVTVSCAPDASAGSNPDIIGSFDIGLGPDGAAGTPDDTGDYNFGGVVNLSPTVPDDAAIPNGAILGQLGSQPTLGLVNNTCSNSQLRVPFTFLKASTDINDTVDMLPFGTGNEMAILSGDNPPFGPTADVKPPPAVTHYPSFLNAIFDSDWVDFGADKIPGNGDDNNGPSPPIKPVFRAAGATSIGAAGNLWVLLQLVVFDKGTKLPNLPPFDPAFGYPSVVVLQASSAAGSATPPAPSAITDFCTPLKTVNVSYGITKDNPDTPANEGGVPVLTLPASGTSITSFVYTFSQRDADGDGFENSLDACPLTADTVYNPRDPTRPIEGDSDLFAGVPAPDGIPDVCDPTPNEASSSPPSNQPTDHDGDYFPNKGDNCPIVANPDQKDSDKNAAGEEIGDGIGDACDPNPGTPDGAEIICIRTVTITVGGPPQAAVSECLTSLPPPPTTTPSSTPTAVATPTRTPAPTPTATPEPNPCRGATSSSSTTSHDVSLDRLAGAGRISDSQAKAYTAIVTNHNLTGAEDIQVCFTVVPMFGCSAPEIDVALPFDTTPGEPDNLYVDVSGDGVRDSVALAVARGVLPDRTERVKATVFFSSCPPPPNQQQTPFDYIVQADACHEGDPPPKGFSGACPGIPHSANDPNQSNDAPIQKAVNDASR